MKIEIDELRLKELERDAAKMMELQKQIELLESENDRIMHFADRCDEAGARMAERAGKKIPARVWGDGVSVLLEALDGLERDAALVKTLRELAAKRKTFSNAAMSMQVSASEDYTSWYRRNEAFVKCTNEILRLLTEQP